MTATASKLNYDFSMKGLAFSTAADLPTMPRHRWYFVKEAFSPALVQRAMESAGCKKGDVVLDPFCGSGTTLLAASAGGAATVGIEVNPFLSFATRAKLTAVQPRHLKLCTAQILAACARGRKSPLEGLSTFSESKGRDKWLFNTAVLRSFEAAWRETASVPRSAKRVFRLALIGAAMDCCNAAQDGKCLRYRSDWKKRDMGKDDFVTALTARLTCIGEDVLATKIALGTTTVIQGDCRRRLKSNAVGKFKLCVTSPPYLNSFDYSDIYRPELFLGKFVRDTQDLREVRLHTLRSHVQVNWPKPTQTEFGPLYANSMSKLLTRKDSLWDQRLPCMVQAYFEDMKTVLVELRARAVDGAHLWIVVATSAYAGVEIPVDLIIADIAGKFGWNLAEIGVIRNLRSSAQHFQTVQGEAKSLLPLRESAIVLRASRSPTGD